MEIEDVIERLHDIKKMQVDAKLDIKISIAFSRKNSRLTRSVYVAEIFNTVCEVGGITKDVLLSKNRGLHLVDLRKIGYWLLRNGSEFTFSITDIARVFGKNHATIINQLSQFNDLYKYDKAFENKATKAKNILAKKILTIYTRQ